MPKLHTNVLHWGNKYDGPNTYKMGREGALEDAYWDEDELVDYPRKSKKAKPKKKKGCPGNDYKAHVYVWVETKHYREVLNGWGWTLDKTRYYIVNRKTCCGCGKVTKSKYDWKTYYERH